MVSAAGPMTTPDTWAEKLGSFERMNLIRETNGNFDSCNLCKRLGTCRLHELHDSKSPFISRVEFIHSKLSNCSARVSGADDVGSSAGRAAGGVGSIADGCRAMGPRRWNRPRPPSTAEHGGSRAEHGGSRAEVTLQ